MSIYRFLFLAMISACASPPTPPQPMQTGSQPSLQAPSDDRINKTVVPLAYDLLLDIDPSQEAYGGQVKINLRLTEPTKEIWLHSLKHTIQVASLHQGSKKWASLKTARAGKDWLSIQLPEVVPAGNASLSLRFSGRFSNPLFGIYRVKEGDDWYLFSQLEALGAREAFPSFDEPGFKTPFHVRIVAPKDVKVFFNTPKLEEKPGRAGKILHRFAKTKPLPTYLLAFAVGPIDVLHRPEWDLKRADGSTLPIRLLAAKGKAHRGKTALRETAKILALEEEYFGSAYPYAKLDIVAVPDFAAGAMENPGLITYREQLLLFDEKVDPIGRYKSYANVHAHELAHIWFGDLVTMAWWDDLWLNEAFATWFAYKMVDQYRPDWQVLTDRLGGFNWVKESDSTTTSRRIREPIKTRGDIENAFDGITYTKGHAVLSMFEQYVGEAAFRTGVRRYLKKHAWGNATFADLLTEIEAAADKPGVKAAFETFIFQPGVPNVAMSGGERCDPVTVRQVRWQPLGSPPLPQEQPWHIPMCFKDLQGGEVHCRLLTKPKDTLTFPESCEGPLLPNPGGAAYMIPSLGGSWVSALLSKQSSMNELEYVALLYDLRKAYSAGNLSPEQVLELAQTITNSSDRVQQQVLGLIGDLGGLVDDKIRPRWQAMLGRLGRVHAKEHGWGDDGIDDPAHWQIRRRTLSWASRWSGDANLKAQAVQMAESLIEGQEIERELAGTALSILVEDGDADLFDKLLKAFKEAEDPWRRSTLLQGLAGFRRSEISLRSLNLALSGELRANEIGRIVWGPSGDYRVRNQAWTWLKKNLTQLREKLPRNSGRYLPYYPSSHCTAKAKQEINELFQPYLEGPQAMEGLSRHISAAGERIDRCLAMRTRHQAALAKTLTQGAERAQPTP